MGSEGEDAEGFRQGVRRTDDAPIIPVEDDTQGFRAYKSHTEDAPASAEEDDTQGYIRPW